MFLEIWDALHSLSTNCIARYFNAANHLSRGQAVKSVQLESLVLLVRFPAETFIYLFSFYSLVFRSLQLGGFPCEWNRARPFNCSYCCLRSQVRLIMQWFVKIYNCRIFFIYPLSMTCVTLSKWLYNVKYFDFSNQPMHMKSTLTYT